MDSHQAQDRNADESSEHHSATAQLDGANDPGQAPRYLEAEPRRGDRERGSEYPSDVASDGAFLPPSRSEPAGPVRFLLSPKWVAFHLLVVFGIVSMVNLGFWQLRRLDQVRSRNAEVAERYDADPMPVETLFAESGDPALGDPILNDLQWLPVVANGTYLPGQVRIVNRSQDGLAGWQALTPLQLDSGQIILINRGFVPLRIDHVDNPLGPVEVLGHLRMTQEKRFGGLSDASEGALVDAQRIDIERLGAQFDSPLLPMYVELGTSAPEHRQDGFPQPIHPPALDEGNHLSYAVQWFIFSLAVAVGWVLAVRHSYRRRHESAQGQSANHPTSDVA